MDGIATDFDRFVSEHENDDIHTLLLSKDKWKGIDAELAANTIACRRKLKGKVPSWHAVYGLRFPESLPVEQCSSEKTAEYKAGIAARLYSENRDRPLRIADLTGGLGVDSWAFSMIADRVLYNEMSPSLAEAARHNFTLLGADNISVHCSEIVPEASGQDASAITPSALLEKFSPDIIFIDPARRSDTGKKVFLIEDCRPDVLALKEDLLSSARFLMVKLSPMADISMVAERMGRQCREIHVIASGRECKELLVIMDREWNGEYSVEVCSDAGNTDEGIFSFTVEEERNAAALLAEEKSGVRAGDFLFEPGKALMKAGAFNLLCSRFGIAKLAASTHLYVSDAEKAEELSSFGKMFRIVEVLPLNKAGIRDIARKYPRAEVSAKNIRMDSDTLRKKLKVSSGDRFHIFGSGCNNSSPLLIVAERI